MKTPTEIAVFKDLVNPKTEQYDPKVVAHRLEEERKEGFPGMSYERIEDQVFAILTGDSDYGARMGVVKSLIAQAMYSPNELQAYFSSVANDLGNKAKTEKQLQIAADACRSLANIVGEIGQEYKGTSVEDIIKLSEIEHIFSGKWNGTGLNLTFTDPKIREYGARMQQDIHRIWFGKNLDTKDKTPLKENDLFPVLYGNN
jgi:hypothetical protein